MSTATHSSTTDDSVQEPIKFLDDHVRREKVLNAIRLGGSRRMAAHYVGIHPSTIARAAAKDEEFLRELQAAEHASEFKALMNINAACENPRYWRAAAWMLERHNSIDFGPKEPQAHNVELTVRSLAYIVEPLIEDIPDKYVATVRQRMRDIVDGLQIHAFTVINQILARDPLRPRPEPDPNDDRAPEPPPTSGPPIDPASNQPPATNHEPPVAPRQPPPPPSSCRAGARHPHQESKESTPPTDSVTADIPVASVDDTGPKSDATRVFNSRAIPTQVYQEQPIQSPQETGSG